VLIRFAIWDERKMPSVIVELLSPKREAEDLSSHFDEPIATVSTENLIPYTIENERKLQNVKPQRWHKD
jgi:hypothetical protein